MRVGGWGVEVVEETGGAECKCAGTLRGATDSPYTKSFVMRLYHWVGLTGAYTPPPTGTVRLTMREPTGSVLSYEYLKPPICTGDRRHSTDA